MKTLFCYSAIIPLTFTIAIYCFANDESIFVAIGSAVIGSSFIKTHTFIQKLTPTNEHSRQHTREELETLIVERNHPEVFDKIMMEESNDFAQTNGHWKLRSDLAKDLAEKVNKRSIQELKKLLNTDRESYEFKTPTEDEKYMVSSSASCRDSQERLNTLSKRSQERIPAFSIGLIPYLLKSLGLISLDDYNDKLACCEKEFQDTRGTGFIRNFFTVITKEELNHPASDNMDWLKVL